MADNKVFDAVNYRKPQTANFDLGHERKYSTKYGLLTPSMVFECVPGDDLRINISAIARLAPQVFPTMHRSDVFTHVWFTPYRILWDGWEEFITGGKDGTTTLVPPTVDIVSPYNFHGQLSDYLGLPTMDDIGTTQKGLVVNALHHYAYQEIFNQHYRDQNL